jgi:hypothetical protein
VSAQVERQARGADGDCVARAAQIAGQSRVDGECVAAVAAMKAATVQEYLDGLAEPPRETGHRLKVVIDAGLPGAVCAIRWAQPTGSLGRAPAPVRRMRK